MSVGDETPVLTLASQALYPLSHLPGIEFKASETSTLPTELLSIPQHNSQYGLWTLLQSLYELTLWSISIWECFSPFRGHWGKIFSIQCSEFGPEKSFLATFSLLRIAQVYGHEWGRVNHCISRPLSPHKLPVNQPQEYANLFFYVVFFPLWRLNFIEQSHLKNLFFDQFPWLVRLACCLWLDKGVEGSS